MLSFRLTAPKRPPLHSINNDPYWDVVISYKTCLDDATNDPGAGAKGFAQIVKGGYPNSGGENLVDCVIKGKNSKCTVDIQLLGITIPPGASANCEPNDEDCLKQEFADGSSFRTREFDHAVNNISE